MLFRSAEQYAEEDQARRDAFAERDGATRLINQAEERIKEAGKDMPKEEKRTLKASIANVQRYLAKRPEKMKDQDKANFTSAIEELKRLLG